MQKQGVETNFEKLAVLKPLISSVQAPAVCSHLVGTEDAHKCSPTAEPVNSYGKMTHLEDAFRSSALDLDPGALRSIR